jgi:hypothetical protein
VSLFSGLIIAHVLAGTVALVSFWVPVVARKGSRNHKRWGDVFVKAVYVAASLACAMGLMNLTIENGRHPMLANRALFDGLFGWMMLYLGLLSLQLVIYGIGVVKNRSNPARNGNSIRLSLNALVGVIALKCGYDGVILQQPLMVALAVLGLITVVTFTRTALTPNPAQTTYLAEHIKAMIAGGISAYTAFLSVGLLRVVPQLVFNPIIWAIPSVIGVMLIIHHLRQLPPRSAA